MRVLDNMEGKYDSLVEKSPIEVQIAIANEQARANEIHKLELEIYLVPRKSIRAEQSPEVQQEIIDKNNKQREEFQKRVKEI